MTQTAHTTRQSSRLLEDRKTLRGIRRSLFLAAVAGCSPVTRGNAWQVTQHCQTCPSRTCKRGRRTAASWFTKLPACKLTCRPEDFTSLAATGDETVRPPLPSKHCQRGVPLGTLLCIQILFIYQVTQSPTHSLTDLLAGWGHAQLTVQH